MYYSHLFDLAIIILEETTCSSSVLTLSIFLLQINGHLMKRNSTRTESSLQKSRGGRNAHVVSEKPAWVGHGPTAPPRELFPRLCEHLGKHESRTSRLHVHVVIFPEFLLTQVLAKPWKQFPRRDPGKRSEWR